MKQIATALLIAIGFALTSCNGGEPNTAEIRVFLNGQVTMNGKPLAPRDFERVFREEREKSKFVLYYRQGEFRGFDLEEPAYAALREADLGVSGQLGGFPPREEELIFK